MPRRHIEASCGPVAAGKGSRVKFPFLSSSFSREGGVRTWTGALCTAARVCPRLRLSSPGSSPPPRPHRPGQPRPSGLSSGVSNSGARFPPAQAAGAAAPAPRPPPSAALAGACLVVVTESAVPVLEGRNWTFSSYVLGLGRHDEAPP